ncbi:MAG TPA: hypothetical protein VHN14_36325 [Kofleriaceae bacterium]|jgi:hypothetical protein|nr:hypothetical protein [Kofleriaceae bacterium]
MSLIVLRWSIASVLGAGAAFLLVSLPRTGHPGHPGGLVALGVAQPVTAALFVGPRTIRAGGVALLGVLAAAALLHAAMGAAAIWVVLAQRTREVAR